MAFGLQPIHLLVIVGVALIIFGPKRLPQIGRWIGKTFAEFRKGAREMADEFRDVSAHPDGPAGNGGQSSTDARQAAAGEPSETACADCGAMNGPAARYCSQCGRLLHG